jgi:hypothetical protein
LCLRDADRSRQHCQVQRQIQCQIDFHC